MKAHVLSFSIVACVGQEMGCIPLQWLMVHVNGNKYMSNDDYT